VGLVGGPVGCMNGAGGLLHLDHAADTPVRQEVLDLVGQLREQSLGNASASHGSGRRARAVVEDARDRLAGVLGVHADEVVFCSGGTEADNLAVRGVLAAAVTTGRPLCSAIEHPAVMEPVLAARGRLIAVDRHGLVTPDSLAEVAGSATSIVSVMAVNNETGSCVPPSVLAALGEVIPGAALHTDAVQAARWLPLAPLMAVVDLMSLASHKIGGPSGVGALVVRRGISIAAQQIGGGQERDVRSGSHDVLGIAGFALAVELAQVEAAALAQQAWCCRRQLLDGLAVHLPSVTVIGASASPGSDEQVVPGIVTLLVPGVEAEALVFLLDRAGVEVSAGSACASGAREPSHVLAALGIEPGLAAGAIRLSMGPSTSLDDMERAVTELTASVRRLVELGS